MMKFAVVGLGRIGMKHVQECRMVKGFRVVALCDLDAGLRQKAEAETGIPGFASYETMLKKTDADVVVIATPSHLHYAMTLQALGEGFHVLVDKPMAQNLAQCRRMQAAAIKAKRFLTVNQSKRFHPDTVHLRRVLGSGKIGNVYSIYNSYTNFNKRTDWQIWKKNNGGMLSNWGVHLVDQILYLMDSEPVTVFAKMNQVQDPGDVEDSFKIVLQFENGAVGEAEALKTLHPKPIWHIAGTQGSILSENVAGINKIRTSIATPSGIRESVLDIDWQRHPLNLLPHYKALKAALDKTGKPAVSVASVLKTMAVLDAARKSAATGRSVKVQAV